MGEHFILPDPSTTDLKVTVLQQKYLKSKLQLETDELGFISSIHTSSSPGLKRDIRFIAHYRHLMSLQDQLQSLSE